MAIVGIFTTQAAKNFAAENSWLYIVAIITVFVCLITLACCEGVRRKTPHNFIFLGLFTAAEGFMLGCVTATYSADEVLMAVGVCAAIVLALTMFAFQTKVDFTAWGGDEDIENYCKNERLNFPFLFRCSYCCSAVFCHLRIHRSILPPEQNTEPCLCQHRMHHLQSLHHL